MVWLTHPVIVILTRSGSGGIESSREARRPQADHGMAVNDVR